MKKFECDKLVRDAALAALENQGIRFESRIIGPDELVGYLKKKIREEAIEVSEVATTEKILDELIDVMEAGLALRKKLGISKDEFRQLYEKKYREKGGFENGICITSITIDKDHPKFEHYRSHPEKYKEL